MATPKDNFNLRCPAKLNLTLAVGSPRDDGLHPIASVMVALDFGDDLQLRQVADGPSTFVRRFADDAPKPQPIDWPIESDLAYRAHAMLESHAGRAIPVACELTKRIPAGAGLGGGSSNAAGMLVGLRELYSISIDDNELLDLANELGADVAFAVHALLGRSAALVTGIGDVIAPLTQLPSFRAVLVFPQGTCPTPAVYRAFDQANLGDSHTIPDDLLQAWTQSDTLPDAHNDLTDAAISVCPAISSGIQTIASLDLQPRLTGSGSALFALVQSQAHAIAITETIRKAGMACCPASFSNLP